jgi:hypothetical protein
MTMDRAVTAWESTLTAETGSARPASRRSIWSGHLVAVLRTTVLLVIATLAILVLLPAAIAAQAAFAG